MDTEKLIRDIVSRVLTKLGEQEVSHTENDFIANEANKAAGATNTVNNAGKKIVCGVSVRHLHLCREHVDVLFGKNYEMQILKELYQPGNYAYKETVTIVGPKLNAIQNIRVLGPLRSKTQVELAKTDCVILGIDASVRASGDLAGTSSCVVIGPKGAVYLKEGVIRANRHMHLSQEDADYFGIKDNSEVDVRISGPKGLTFNNVQVRVSLDYKSEMHVDTDDANAADVVNGTLAEIVDASCISPITSLIADQKDIPPQIPDSSFTGEITDTNILKSMNNLISGKSLAELQKKSNLNFTQKNNMKKIITVEDLDDYKDSGIEIKDNVILSPLAKDEAINRGIEIKYIE